MEPDFFEVDLEEGDYILLCSDGLSNMLEDQSMYESSQEREALRKRQPFL